MAKQILITGGAGFVGSHVADELLRRGHEVRILDNLTPQVHHDGWPDYLPKDVELMHGDMRNLDEVRHAVAGVDVIFHLAAAVGVGQSMYEISQYMGSNTQGTANLLQALLDTNVKIEKLVVASSMSIYGEGKYLCERVRGSRSRTAKREAVEGQAMGDAVSGLRPRVEAGRDRRVQAAAVYFHLCAEQERSGGDGAAVRADLRCCRWWRCATSTSMERGRRCRIPIPGVAAIFASRLLNRRAPMVFEDARQMRDFVSVHDVVQANMLAMERIGS